jgi:hypothetical protein
MLRSVFFTALLALSASATAQEFDYNYLSIGYQQIDIDDGLFNADGDGFGIKGSFEVSESFYLFAGYTAAELESIVDVDEISAGVGWHTPLSDRMDFLAELSYESLELSASGFGSAETDGFGVLAGLRFRASDAVEVNGGVKYEDYGDDGDDTGFGLGVLVGVTDNIEIGLTGEWADDISTYGVNGRMYFGN